MDASRDLMNATYQYLKKGRVEGSTVLPFEQLVELINDRVAAAKPCLREISLPTIRSQVVGCSGMPDDFGLVHALKIYSFGDEAWGDAKTAHYWFVDRDGRWFWAAYDSMTRWQDWSEVSSKHFAETRRVPDSPDLAHIECLYAISEVFRHKFKQAAESAREREESLRAAVVEQSAFKTTLRALTS